MDEVFTNYCNYAAMVKGIDPNALVAGPEEWSWPGYLYSGYDQTMVRRAQRLETRRIIPIARRMADRILGRGF